MRRQPQCSLVKDATSTKSSLRVVVGCLIWSGLIWSGLVRAENAKERIDALLRESYVYTDRHPLNVYPPRFSLDPQHSQAIRYG